MAARPSPVRAVLNRPQGTDGPGPDLAPGAVAPGGDDLPDLAGEHPSVPILFGDGLAGLAFHQGLVHPPSLGIEQIRRQASGRKAGAAALFPQNQDAVGQAAFFQRRLQGSHRPPVADDLFQHGKPAPFPACREGESRQRRILIYKGIIAQSREISQEKPGPSKGKSALPRNYGAGRF